MKVTEVKIDDIIFAEYNPRELTEEQHKHLKDSLKRFGMVDPVIVNKHKERKNILVGGHQRCRVWKELGNDTIPVVYVELDYDKERELNVRLNKNTGQFNYDLLANLFDHTELIEWGFDPEELGMGDEEDSSQDDIKEPEIPEPITCPKCGHTWEK